jgi:DNA-binding MarR family transcriptional regulator
MTKTLREELRQGRPFRSVHEEAHLNVVRTAALFNDSIEQLMKQFGITAAQYNVLRILRGAQPEGLCRNDLRARLVTRMPDVTRLLDRMEEAGLVVREREEEDRRMVRTRLTRSGRRLVDDLDPVVAAEHQRLLGHLNRNQLKALIELSTLARSQE